MSIFSKLDMDMTNTNATTLAAANNITVFAVSVVSESSGAVDWFTDHDSASAYFDDQVTKFADIEGELISLFPVTVPSGISKEEITNLVDEAMHEEAFVALRQHFTTEVYYPTPLSVLKKLIGITEERVQDIKSGLADGTYEQHRNVGLAQIETTLAKAEAVIGNDEQRLEGLPFNRTLVLEAKATSDQCETPDYCEVQLSKEDLAKIIHLSKVCEVMGLSDVRFDFTPNSWGSEGIEDRADLENQSIVVASNEQFWVVAQADNFNCHYESEIQDVGSIISWMKEDKSPIIFESDEVQESYRDNQKAEECDEEE